MWYKALKSFAGIISMNAGEVRKISDSSIAHNLLKVGYIEEIKIKKASWKGVKK